MKILKPGQRAPISCQVEIIGPKGGRTGIERTIVKGIKLPPTLIAGQKFLIVDKTKTK